jgi:hypothetical protein
MKIEYKLHIIPTDWIEIRLPRKYRPIDTIKTFKKKHFAINWIKDHGDTTKAYIIDKCWDDGNTYGSSWYRFARIWPEIYVNRDGQWVTETWEFSKTGRIKN